MSYNTAFTRFKSSDLAGLDCGGYLKVPRRDRKHTLDARYTGDLEVGQCAAMIRVPAGARIVGMNLTWERGGTTVLAVGDPYACARFIGPVHTVRNSGFIAVAAVAGDCTAMQPYGTCGRLMRTGTVGDGCGLFYQYTCETDIVVTNLYNAGFAAMGGWAGGSQGATGPDGAKWTGGSIVLEVEYLSQS